MDTAREYIEKTRSSVEHIFGGIRTYVDVLCESEVPVFVADIEQDEAAFEAAFEIWVEENESLFERRREAEKRYFSQAFAQANLCGALLQQA